MTRVDQVLTASAVVLILLLHRALTVEQTAPAMPQRSAGSASGVVRTAVAPAALPPVAGRLTATVEQPLFFEGRRLPASTSVSPATPASPTTPTTPTGPHHDTPYRLLGVAIVGTRRVALVEAAGTGDVSSATEGEALSQGWSVASIAADAVTLQRAGTRTMLWLFPERPRPGASDGGEGAPPSGGVAAGIPTPSPLNDPPTFDESAP